MKHPTTETSTNALFDAAIAAIPRAATTREQMIYRADWLASAPKIKIVNSWWEAIRFREYHSPKFTPREHGEDVENAERARLAILFFYPEYAATMNRLCDDRNSRRMGFQRLEALPFAELAATAEQVAA